MCGLAGLYRFDGAPVQAPLLRRMSRLQAHRGPDDAGLRLFSLATRRSVEPATADDAPSGFEGGVSFVRLSIQDLSPAGHQPMTDPEQTTILVFNGEIYNAAPLRAQLEAAGFAFRGHSDTEVILHGYRHWGLDGVLARLDGMFAFAVVDLLRSRIVLARDRYGIKPLYYTLDDRRLAFASEIKALFALPDVDFGIDEDRIDEFLMFRCVAGAATLFRAVRQLEPGHCLVAGPDGVSQSRYWSAPVRGSGSAQSMAQAEAAVSEALDAAVSRQLVSDVPLGTQLSGGIDSSLIASLAASRSGSPMAAFGVVFDDPRYTEEPWIDRVAGSCGLEAHKIRLTADEVFRLFGDAGWFMDQPLGHPNSLGILEIARCARPHVSVLLSGEGADELFAGYHRYLYPQWGPRLAPLLPLLTRLPKVGAKFERRFSRATDLDAGERFILSNAYIRPEALRRLRPQSDPGRPLAERRALFGDGAEPLLDRCLKYDLAAFLPDLLVRQDKMTMAHSVENRVPFLDNALFDLAWSLPPDLLLHPGFGLEPWAARSTKRVLKSIAARTFGTAFAYRPKSGFALPLPALLRDRRAGETLLDVALPALRDRAGVATEQAARLVRTPDAWTAADVEMLWILLSFGDWLAGYVERGKAAAAAA